jgi:hypothetical protein
VVVKPAVLEIGVGNWRWEQFVLGGEAFSVDRDERALARLAVKCVKCYVDKVEDLAFNDEDLDFVVVSEVLELLDAERTKGLDDPNRTAFVSLPANSAPAWIKSLVRIVPAKSEEAIGSPNVYSVAGSPRSLSRTTE